jgi:hypothetical protein
MKYRKFGGLLIGFMLLNSVIFANQIKVGLDSGHSIKELHKSGGAFNVHIRNDASGNPVYEPYYAVGWSRTNLFS